MNDLDGEQKRKILTHQDAYKPLYFHPDWSPLPESSAIQLALNPRTISKVSFSSAIASENLRYASPSVVIYCTKVTHCWLTRSCVPLALTCKSATQERLPIQGPKHKQITRYPCHELCMQLHGAIQGTIGMSSTRCSCNMRSISDSVDIWRG